MKQSKCTPRRSSFGKKSEIVVDVENHQFLDTSLVQLLSIQKYLANQIKIISNSQDGTSRIKSQSNGFKGWKSLKMRCNCKQIFDISLNLKKQIKQTVYHIQKQIRNCFADISNFLTIFISKCSKTNNKQNDKLIKQENTKDQKSLQKFKQENYQLKEINQKLKFKQEDKNIFTLENKHKKEQNKLSELLEEINFKLQLNQPRFLTPEVPKVLRKNSQKYFHHKERQSSVKSKKQQQIYRQLSNNHQKAKHSLVNNPSLTSNTIQLNNTLIYRTGQKQIRKQFDLQRYDTYVYPLQGKQNKNIPQKRAKSSKKLQVFSAM